MNYKEQALNAVQKTDYVLAFQTLEKAGVMNTDLEFLKKSLIKGRIDADFEERLQLAIENAFRDAANAPKNPQKLLPIPAPPAQFVGRRQDLDALHASLKAGKRTLLLNGVGGVGKTALAQKYAAEYAPEYAHILWIRQNGQLFSSFIDEKLFAKLCLDLSKQQDNETAFENLLGALAELHGTNLLIVDDYEKKDDDQTRDTVGKLFALPAHWRIVCTSRAHVPFFDAVQNIDVLPAAEAVELFKRHATGKPCDDAEVTKLLDMVGFHTLMVELLAKTYRESMHFEGVGALHAFLQTESLKHQKLQEEIYMGKQAIEMYAYLRVVFSLASLNDEEVWLLKQWAVLPAAPHKAEDFLKWIQDNALAYENTLLALVEKGWLQIADGLAYFLHPLLQIFLLEELKPTFEDCAKMCVYFRDFIKLEAVEANPIARQYLIAPIESMIQHIDFTGHEQKQGILWDRARFFYKLLGDYSNAVRCAKENLAINKATTGERHQGYAASLNNLALLYKNQGDYAAALPLYEESVPIWKEVLGEQHPHYAATLNNLAELYDSQGNYAAALPLYQKSLQIRKEGLGERHPDYATSLNNLAGLYDSQGDYAAAQPLYEESLPIWKEVLGEQHPYYAATLNNLAGLYDSRGNYAAAIPLYQKSLQIRKEGLGERHPDYATTLNNLAFLYKNQGDYAAALPLYQESLRIMKEVLGEQHPDYATTLNNLAGLYLSQGDYAAVLPLYQESLQIRKEVLGEQHPDYAASLNNLAILHDNQGNYAAALPLYQESSQIWKEVLGEQHPDYAASLHNLGALYFKQENYIQAKEYLEKAYSIFLEKLGEQHPRTKNTKKWLDNLLSNQKNYIQVKEYLEKAYNIRVEKLGEQHQDTKKTKEGLDNLP